jgi:hypothetical protein
MTEDARPGDWHFAGRYYLTTMAGDLDRDGMALEVEDVAPAPGRWIVAEVYYSDQSGEMTFSALTTDPLPLALIERIVAEAQRVLPPRPTRD